MISLDIGTPVRANLRPVPDLSPLKIWMMGDPASGADLSMRGRVVGAYVGM